MRLNAGDRVPSDGLLVDGSDVTCNESALTGESEDKVSTKIVPYVHLYVHILAYQYHGYYFCIFFLHINLWFHFFFSFH